MKAKRLSDTQLDKALAVAAPDMAVAIILSNHAGLRCMELAGLDWAFLTDAEGNLSGEIDLPNIATKGRTGERVVALSAKAKAIVSEFWQAKGRPASGPVIEAKSGGFTTSDALRDKFKRVYAKANLKASSHSGRRSFASRLLERGACAYTLQAAMGHREVASTETYLREAASAEAGSLIAGF